MKIIVTGATGFVGTEVIRQALLLPTITTLVAVSRSPLTLPPNIPTTKLRQVIVPDYHIYPDSALQEFAGADGCIWTVAITPGKAQAYDAAAVRRACFGSTVDGLAAMWAAGPARPFRFVYMSGMYAQRGEGPVALPVRYLPSMASYLKMRGETEAHVVDFAAEQEAGAMEAVVLRAPLIARMGSLGSWLGGMVMQVVTVEETAAMMLGIAVRGCEKQTLEAKEMREMGKEAWKEAEKMTVKQ